MTEIIKPSEKFVSDKQKTDELVLQLKGGLEQAIGFLSEELIKIGTASPNKIIDINDSNIKQAVQTFIYADPDDPKYQGKSGGVLSVTATIKDNEKKIKKWIEEGYAPEAFDEIRKEMQKLPDKLAKELSTQESVDTLIKERVKNNSILRHMALNSDETTPIYAVKKNNIINKINQNIEISPNIVSILLQGKNFQPLIQQITAVASKCFGQENKFVPYACLVDEQKLTPKNIANFAEITNSTIKAFEKIHGSLKDSSLDVTEKQEITKILLPTLSNLTPENTSECTEITNRTIKAFEKIQENLKNSSLNITELLKSNLLPKNHVLPKLDLFYLAENSTEIATELKDINDRGTSLWEKFKQVFNGKDYLGQRLEKVVNEYIIKSDEYVVKVINDKVFSNALTNPEIAEGLTKFLNENKDKAATNPKLTNLIPIAGETIIVQPQQVNNFNLAEVRKINPIAFDKTIFEDSLKLRSSNIKPPQNTPNPLTQNQTRNRG